MVAVDEVAFASDCRVDSTRWHQVYVPGRRSVVIGDDMSDDHDGLVAVARGWASVGGRRRFSGHRRQGFGRGSIFILYGHGRGSISNLLGTHWIAGLAGMALLFVLANP